MYLLLIMIKTMIFQASESSLEPLESKEETHHLAVEMFPEIPMAHVGVLSPNLRKITRRHPSTKAIFAMGFMAVVGLLSVSYTINRHGHLVPTALLRQPPLSFGFFLAIIMIIFYCAAIGMIVQEVFPLVFRVLNLIAFVLLVLGVTVLLWSLIPNYFCWVPWLLFSCTVMAALGVMIHERFARVPFSVKMIKEYVHAGIVFMRRRREDRT